MSNDINADLLERAADMIDVWDGTIMAKLIEYDIERGDMEELHQHVCEAEALLRKQEAEATDVA